MSYEIESKSEVACPCGKGKISKITWSNDWFQTKENLTIHCENCSSQYHIEHIFSMHSDQTIDIPYMVPNGETLARSSSYNIKEIHFEEQLCRSFTKTVLTQSLDILMNSTSYSKIKDETTRSIVRSCKKATTTMKITVVREYVFKALEIYDGFDLNYERDTIRVNELKCKCISLNKF